MFFIGEVITYILKHLIEVSDFVSGIGARLIICSAILCLISRFIGLDRLKESKKKNFKSSILKMRSNAILTLLFMRSLRINLVTEIMHEIFKGYKWPQSIHFNR